MKKLENLKSFDEYTTLTEGLDDFNINENSIEFESDGEDEVYHEGNLYESAPRMTAQQRKKGQQLSKLMSVLNKSANYKAAKEKFVKVLKVEAKKAVKTANLPPNVLGKLSKITLRDI